MNINNNVSDYFNNATEAQIALLNELRKLIHDTVDNVSEEIKWNMPVFNNGKGFAYLRFSKKHITLGLHNIDKIQDPDNLLEGEGNTLKHLKIALLEDKQKKQIAKWLKLITE